MMEGRVGSTDLLDKTFCEKFSFLSCVCQLVMELPRWMWD